MSALRRFLTIRVRHRASSSLRSLPLADRQATRKIDALTRQGETLNLAASALLNEMPPIEIPEKRGRKRPSPIARKKAPLTPRSKAER